MKNTDIFINYVKINSCVRPKAEIILKQHESSPGSVHMSRHEMYQHLSQKTGARMNSGKTDIDPGRIFAGTAFMVCAIKLFLLFWIEKTRIIDLSLTISIVNC